VNTINIKAESEMVEPSIPEGLPYVSVDITVAIDHKEFGTTFADAEVIDGYQLLATRHAGGSPYLLSCGCGEPATTYSLRGLPKAFRGAYRWNTTRI
jgi:hypothetical protein